MSNRNFDNRVIIQRLQNQCYARSLYGNNINGRRIISNPQTTDGTSSRYVTYDEGSQTEYARGLTGNCVSVSPGGICGITPEITTECFMGSLNYSFTYTGAPGTITEQIVLNNVPLITLPGLFSYSLNKITIVENQVNVLLYITFCKYTSYYTPDYYPGDFGLSFNNLALITWYNSNTTNLTLISSSLCPFSTAGNQFTVLSGSVYTGLTNLTILSSFVPYFRPNTSLENCFRACPNFNSNISGWDTTNVINMAGMFRQTDSFNQPLNTWNVSNVTNMADMFRLTGAFNQPLNNWNTSKVTDMSSMFRSTTKFNGDITTWDVSNVTTMSNMFRDATGFNQAIGSWNTSNVTTMTVMFAVASGLISIFNQPIGSWNTSKVTDMSSMFSRAVAFNRNISAWDTSNVTTMAGMFSFASTFNNGNTSLNSWNTSKVTNMSSMFQNANAFNQPIGAWDTSKVTTMASMFAVTSGTISVFNQPIGSWNTSSVTTMSAMFQNARVFNQYIGNWNTSNVRTMTNMFQGARLFNNGELGYVSIPTITPSTSSYAASTPSPIGILTCPGASLIGNVLVDDILIIQATISGVSTVYSGRVTAVSSTTATLSPALNLAIPNISPSPPTTVITSITKQVAGTKPLLWDTTKLTSTNTSVFQNAAFFNQNLTTSGNIWKMNNGVALTLTNFFQASAANNINLFNNGQITSGVTAPMGWTFSAGTTLTNFRERCVLSNNNKPSAVS